jgi:hypothetical protein
MLLPDGVAGRVRCDPATVHNTRDGIGHVPQDVTGRLGIGPSRLNRGTVSWPAQPRRGRLLHMPDAVAP